MIILSIVTIGITGNVCELQINSCPKDYENKVIKVPLDVVSISRMISMCRWVDFVEGVSTATKPPSIMFIIDHSYSMMGLGNTYPGNDVDGTRFKVSRDLIDTIYNRHPDAEVGLAVFREVLYFDHRNNQMFVPLNGQSDQSYLPLMQLNTKFKGNQSGVDVVKSILRTGTVTRTNEINKQSVTCTDLVYTPGFPTIGNTNINNAFEAALQAMKNAKNPPERQFVIFLSDGEPFPLNDSTQHGDKNPFYFMQGTTTPTTFTVYLHNIETQAPSSIKTFTNNVRSNNYSSSNAYSDVWTLKTDYNALMSLIMKNIMTPIFSVTQGIATRLTLNNDISTTLDGENFVFDTSIPLCKDTTILNMNMHFRVSGTNAASQTDSTFTFGFKIVREKEAVLPDGLAKICHEQPGLALYYDSRQIYQITDPMRKLEVRFDPKNFSYSSVEVEVRSSNTLQTDVEKVKLTYQTSFWSGTFHRNTGKIKVSDGTFQHGPNDSIIIIYRNPLIPLDTVRYAVPYLSVIPSDTTLPGTTSFQLITDVINNPMNSTSQIPDIVRTAVTAQQGYCPEYGSVIAVIPDGEVKTGILIEGTISIYDVVKNPVIRKKKMTADSEKRLLYAWDGRNSAGRAVASGTYLAVVEVKIDKRTEKVSKRYLGVQR
jgi:hypothetical protein